MPCYKLGIRFGRSDILKRFLASLRTGFYFKVIREGEVEAGNQIEMLETDKAGVRVEDITRLYVSERNNVELIRRAIQVQALPDSWRDYFRARIQKLAE